MSGTAPHPRQAVVAAWLANMVGTAVVAGAIFGFVKLSGPPFAAGGRELHRYTTTAILAAAIPSIGYLRAYRARLARDDAAARARGGVPETAARKGLLRGLALGGGLCELPMAVGALDLVCGGEPRVFIAAAVLTLVLRLSYRPFLREPAA